MVTLTVASEVVTFSSSHFETLGRRVVKVVDSVSVGRKPTPREASTSYRVPGDRPDSFFIAVPVTVVMVIGGLLQGWVSSVR